MQRGPCTANAVEARLAPAAVIVAACLITSCAGGARDIDPSVHDFETGSDAQLVGLSVVDSNVWWIGGMRGTVLRTLNGGSSWRVFTLPGADSLQFRDVRAFDGDRAYALSIGPGEKSRIYYTEDGGERWSKQWVNQDPEGFFDCFDFWTPDAGLAMGDANGGRIAILGTVDGTSWARLPAEQIPRALGSEGGFAASGTCLVAAGDSTAWIATGSPEGSRVYRTRNRGRSWDVSDVGFSKGMEAAGLMTLAFRNLEHGFTAGGVLSRPDDKWSNLMETRDGGVTWTLMDGPQLPNVYGLAVSPGSVTSTILAVGPKGMDVSTDDGRSWRSLDKRNYWSVQFVDENTAVAVGPAGRVSRVSFSTDLTR